MKRKVFALLLTALLTLSLAACGSGGDSSAEEAGKYNLVSFTIGQFEVGAQEQYLELMGKGKGLLYDGENEADVTYTMDGTSFTLERNGNAFTGTIEGGVITLDIPPETFGANGDAGSVVWTFARDGSQEEAALKAEADAKGSLETQMEGMDLDELTKWLGQYDGVLDSEETE